MGIQLSLADYGLYLATELKQNGINEQDVSKDVLEAKIREFFAASQTDGNPECLGDTEIKQAIDLAKQYAQELKAKGEKPSLTPIIVNSAQVAPETGSVVAIVCVNGATCQIKGNTITTILDGTETTREMTEAEKKLPTNELLEQLKKANTLESKVAEKQVQETPTEAKESVDNGARKISGNGVIGTYAFIENEDGSYKIDQLLVVNAYKNQAYKAYTKGLRNEFGSMQVKPNNNGVLCFRKDAATLESALDMVVQNSAKDVAIKTEIYKDLQVRQNNGDELSNAELRFMQDYNNLLQTCGLQMNENGELEDIPSKTKRKR